MTPVPIDHPRYRNTPAEDRAALDALRELAKSWRDVPDVGTADAEWRTLARALLAALDVVEAADHAVAVLGLEDSISKLGDALAQFNERIGRG